MVNHKYIVEYYKGYNEDLFFDHELFELNDYNNENVNMIMEQTEFTKNQIHFINEIGLYNIIFG